MVVGRKREKEKGFRNTGLTVRARGAVEEGEEWHLDNGVIEMM